MDHTKDQTRRRQSNPDRAPVRNPSDAQNPHISNPHGCFTIKHLTLRKLWYAFVADTSRVWQTEARDCNKL